MSRSLLGFLTFLIVLAGVVGLVVWWVGPASLSLALDEERRGSPYYLAHLLRGDDHSRYFESFGPLLREEEGRLLWRGGLAALHEGNITDEYRDVAIMGFEAGGDVLQMLTSATFRELAAGMQPLILGTAAPPAAIAHDETLLLWLLEVGEDADADALAAMGASAGAYQGQVVWSTTVAPLTGTAQWNYLLLLAFPEPDDVTSWLADPETATLRALTRRYFLDDALLELRSG